MGAATGRGRLIRSTASVAVPTVISRILGYVRDLFLAFFLGTGDGADAFTIAFTLPNLLRRLAGEGAFSAAYVPAHIEIDRTGDRKRLARFNGAFFADAAVVLLVLTVLGVVFAPRLVDIFAFGFRGTAGKAAATAAMTRTMFPYILFISLASLASSVLNARGRFILPAAGPIVFNVVMIAGAVLWAGRSSNPAGVFAASVTAGGLLQFAVLVPALVREGVPLRFRPSFTNPDVRRTARLFLPGFLGVGVYQINFAVSRLLASGLEPGSASALYFASRIEELTLGIFSIALSVALLPAFSERAAARDMAGIRNTLGFSLKLAALVSVPAAAGLAVLREPIVRVLFQRGEFGGRSTELCAVCLLYFAVGLPFISGVKVMAPAFFSLKDMASPVMAGMAVMAVNIGLAMVLSGPLRVGGLAAALSIAGALDFLILFVLIRRRIGGLDTRGLASFGARIVAAAVLMAAAVKALHSCFWKEGLSFPVQALLLGGSIVCGAAVYFVVLSMLVPGGASKLLREIGQGRERS